MIGYILIGIVCVAAYSNTTHVPFQFDDPYNIVEKSYVRDIRHFLGGTEGEEFSPDHGFRMRPVGYFTFALNYRVHGADVVGYHVVNLAIHVLNALLVHGLVMLLFQTPAMLGTPLKDSSRRLALFASLLFASHPVQTEAVTYIVQRLASLATLFYLASLVTYLRARLSSPEAPGRYASLPWCAGSLIFAVLAMKTKEISFTLPLVVVLCEFLFFRGRGVRRMLCVAPLLLTTAIIPAGLLAGGNKLGELIGESGAATRIESSLSRGEYLLTQFRVMVTYLRLLVLPVNQNLDYDYPVYRSFSQPEVFLSFLFLSALFGLGVYLLRRDRKCPSGVRLVSFGIFWFFITLSVESSVIPIVDVIFEHRVYLPSVGFCIAVVGALFLFARKLEACRKGAERVLVAGLSVAVVALCVLAYARNGVWGSEVSLWEDTVKKSPAKARSYNGLGLAYENAGRNDEAIRSYAKAVVIRPEYPVAYNNLGSVYTKEKQYDRAIQEYSTAISLEPGNAIFRNNRGIAYLYASDLDRAIADFLSAISLDTYYAAAYGFLGIAFHGKGMDERAVEVFSRAISLRPEDVSFHYNRALSYGSMKEYDKAIADSTRAIALDPGVAEVYIGRGVFYAELGRFDESIADFTSAISIDPGQRNYYTNRAVAYQRAGKRDRAILDFRKACEMGDRDGCDALRSLQDDRRS